jgi:hypothetical protein
MLKRCSALILAGILALSCSSEQGARDVLERAVEAHGGDVLDHAVVEFDFRGRHFTVRRDGGSFEYVRAYRDSMGSVREILSNDGPAVEINGESIPLDEIGKRRITSRVNSVVYFALLPYFLLDPAVRSSYLGEVVLDGEPYHKVEVTFVEEGGGQDWQDRFVYWFHRDTYFLDYLAYFYLTDETGVRFREAVNPRMIEGVRVLDYINYTVPLDTIGRNVHLLDTVFEAGGLERLSEVLLENVTVQPLN